ncbi:hypothetical protein DCO47_13225 [Pseudomonas sp. NDM]|nr:hypothetical protein DCO47_13225 [Pseudomonas sp. NDM]
MPWGRPKKRSSARPTSSPHPTPKTAWRRRSKSTFSRTDSHRKNCRSEPARDGGVSANEMVADTPLSRAGSLLHGVCSVSYSQ